MKLRNLITVNESHLSGLADGDDHLVQIKSVSREVIFVQLGVILRLHNHPQPGHVLVV